MILEQFFHKTGEKIIRYTFPKEIDLKIITPIKITILSHTIDVMFQFKELKRKNFIKAPDDLLINIKDVKLIKNLKANEITTKKVKDNF